MLVFNRSLKKKLFFKAEDGIRDDKESRGLGDVYKRQGVHRAAGHACAVVQEVVRGAATALVAASSQRSEVRAERNGGCVVAQKRHVGRLDAHKRVLVAQRVGVCLAREALAVRVVHSTVDIVAVAFVHHVIKRVLAHTVLENEVVNALAAKRAAALQTVLANWNLHTCIVG